MFKLTIKMFIIFLKFLEFDIFLSKIVNLIKNKV